MEILIRTDIKPLLGMDWMRKIKLTIGRVQLVENNQSGNEKVFRMFPDLFENNRTIKEAETNRKHNPGQLYSKTENQNEITTLARCGEIFRKTNQSRTFTEKK